MAHSGKDNYKIYKQKTQDCSKDFSKRNQIMMLINSITIGKNRNQLLRTSLTILSSLKMVAAEKEKECSTNQSTLTLTKTDQDKTSN